MSAGERRRDLAWVKGGAVASVALLAALLGWVVGVETTAARGWLIAGALVLSFGMGLLWAAADVAGDHLPGEGAR